MKIARLMAAMFFGCAALAAIRLAVADTISRRGTPESVTSAIGWTWPTPAAELEQMLAEADPARATEAYQRAVGVNPRASAAWIDLGLLEERDGHLPSAEQALRQAAIVDHQLLPAWTLANFYFRRADQRQFWQWADRSAALTYDDFRPLLGLCDQFETDPARMLAHFQDPRRLRQHYLDFLIGEKRLDAAQQVARGMSGERTNDPLLIDLADRQLRAGNARSAIEMWNASSGFSPIEPSDGRILTNGDLARAPLNLGFDWRLGQVPGIAQTWRPSELTFTLSGSQPEACVLLEQAIYLVRRPFRLRFDYTTGRTSPTGIHWALDNVEGPPIDASSQWRPGSFTLPRADGLKSLKLFYRRDPGTTRTQGRLEIRNLRLEAPSSPLEP